MKYLIIGLFSVLCMTSCGTSKQAIKDGNYASNTSNTLLATACRLFYGN